jgi:hypothetical protein
MAVETQRGIPSVIQSGDTVNFAWNSSLYPPSAWSATIYLSRNGAMALSKAATEDGQDYEFTFTAIETAALVAGQYSYIVRYTETATSETETGERGQMLVTPNLAASQTASIAQQMLTALETAILALNTTANQSVSFNGQSFTKTDLGTLYRQRTLLQAEVAREKDALSAMLGENTGHNYQVRFRNPQ